jgi:lipopolysaccharide export LptBFGC system permease protein LptF
VGRFGLMVNLPPLLTALAPVSVILAVALRLLRRAF